MQVKLNWECDDDLSYGEAAHGFSPPALCYHLSCHTPFDLSTHVRQQDVQYKQHFGGSSTLPHSNVQPTSAVTQTNPISSKKATAQHRTCTTLYSNRKFMETTPSILCANATEGAVCGVTWTSETKAKKKRN